jgi:DNA-binding SARP family transcriptional activator
MEFRLLGPLEATVEGRPVPLHGIKQRATLGLLLLHANRVVATSTLLRGLWPDDVPPTARKMLQNAISSLRATLAMGDREDSSALLLTHAPGYLLSIEPDVLDLVRFNRLVEKSRNELAAASWAVAARGLRQALALWRGPVLADLVEAGISWPEINALKDSRLSALEDCYEAELACGRHREVIGELEELVETEPSRERLCGQLMLALYRDGRQVDALDVFRRIRTKLVDNLGLEPGRELQELERAILAQDPDLDLPGVGTIPGLRLVGKRDLRWLEARLRSGDGSPAEVTNPDDLVHIGIDALPAQDITSAEVSERYLNNWKRQFVPDRHAGLIADGTAHASTREDHLVDEIRELKIALAEAYAELRASHLGGNLPRKRDERRTRVARLYRQSGPKLVSRRLVGSQFGRG